MLNKLLVIIIFLSSCTYNGGKLLHSKGIIAGFYEQKNNAGINKYVSIQDTSGKILSILSKKCEGCLLNDSVKFVYYDQSIIQDNGDKFEIDSCEKFSRLNWKAEKVVIKHINLDSTGRNYKEIDTTYIFR